MLWVVRIRKSIYHVASHLFDAWTFFFSLLDLFILLSDNLLCLVNKLLRRLVHRRAHHSRPHIQRAHPWLLECLLLLWTHLLWDGTLLVPYGVKVSVLLALKMREVLNGLLLDTHLAEHFIWIGQ
jgi:hypothetical protein